MVLLADDKLVPKFLNALEENGQQFLADMLRQQGDFFITDQIQGRLLAYNVSNVSGDRNVVLGTIFHDL